MKNSHPRFNQSVFVPRTRLEANAASALPTPWGTFRIHGFRVHGTRDEHLALTLGRVRDSGPVLGRVHSECLTGDAFLSLRCDCGSQLRAALARIGAERRGVLVYLRQEGRGIGLFNKIRAYALQDEGLDTVDANVALGFEADARRYGVAAEVLHSLGIRQVRLMTNNPGKVKGLNDEGIQVVERIPLLVDQHSVNEHYLRTKASRLGHMLEV